MNIYFFIKNKKEYITNNRSWLKIDIHELINNTEFLQSLAEIINQKNFNNIDDVKDFVTDYIQNNYSIDNDEELDELVTDCISNFYVLDSSDQYIYAFDDHPGLMDSMMLDIIDDLPATLAKLTLKVTNCRNNTQLIKDIIVEAIRELYEFDKFEQCFVYADTTAFLYFHINDIKRVINTVFINEDNINRINKALRNIKQSEVDLISNALELINIDELNINVGQEKPLDEAFFNRLHHLSQFKPVIYINGNVISGKDSTGKERNHHSLLYDDYFNNEELHKHDIIKMPMEEWKKVKYTDIKKYHGVSAVIQTKNVCTIDGFNYTQEAANAINKEFGCKVFAVNFSDEPYNGLII